MGNSTRNVNKKSTKTGLNDKTKERRWNMQRRKGKGNTRKNNNTTWGNKPESTGKKGRLKKYRQRVKQNSTFQNNERKFYQQVGGDDTKTYQQPDARETEQFWTKIWQPRECNEKPNG